MKEEDMISSEEGFINSQAFLILIIVAYNLYHL